MSRIPKKKTIHRIRNRRESNQALVKRGSLTVWVDPQAIDAWAHSGPSQRGAQYVDSDAAIPCLLTLRAVFHLPLRAAQGLAGSIFGLMGPDLAVPHYGTLSRRAAGPDRGPGPQGAGPSAGEPGGGRGLRQAEGASGVGGKPHPHPHPTPS